MIEWSEKVRSFVERNLPKGEKISAEEILKLVKKYNLKIANHDQFLAITAENDPDDTALVLAQASRGSWAGFIWELKDVNLEYSVEDVTIIGATIIPCMSGQKPCSAEIHYHPRLKKGAVLFGMIRSHSSNFGKFWDEFFCSKIKTVCLPEEVVFLPLPERRMTIFSSELPEYTARLQKNSSA